MKKVIVMFLAVVGACGVFAQTAVDYEEIQREHLRSKNIEVQTRRNDRYGNLFEKIPSGYVGSVALAINAPGAYPETAAGVETVHGWMVRPKMFLGAGAGYIRAFRYDEAVIPLFAEARFYFASEYMRRIYPHLGLRLGGQFASEGGGGFYSQAACGFRIPMSERFAISLEVGPQYVTKYTRGGRHDSTVTYKSPWMVNGYTFGFFGRLSFEF
ncbi:MAG: hypothetical protein K2F96_00480 [Muribaculaceae bacterium]|nr:hypothetical protein [Muribaculaceae bacterium]